MTYPRGPGRFGPGPAAGTRTGLARSPTACSCASDRRARTCELRARGDPDGYEHQAALEAIANANVFNGVPTRATGTNGHNASVVYVTNLMKAAGWTVVEQPFVGDIFYHQLGDTLAHVDNTGSSSSAMRRSTRSGRSRDDLGGERHRQGMEHVDEGVRLAGRPARPVARSG